MAPAVGIAISPPALSLMVADERRLTARAYDAHGRTTNASFEWSSANPAIATVGKSDGSVTAISAGTTTVTATAGTLRETASVSVRSSDPPVALSLSISPSELILIAGEFERLTAYAWDSSARPRSVSVEWSSADPAVATVGKIDGTVSAISLGGTTLTAAAGALRATVTVLVVPTAGSLSGTFAFTRATSSSDGSVTLDVQTFSGADRTLRSLPRPAQFGSIAAPAWSPDGTQLAVEVIHDFYIDHGIWYGDYSSDLYVMNPAAPADTPWRALTANRVSTSPSWSPDGKRIAYVVDNSDIYIVDAAGGVPVRLTRTSGEYGAPRWSPDGTRLAFSSAEGKNSEIFIVNADGSGLTNVTRNSAWDVEPSWSPDGARLAFVTNRDGFPGNVFVIDADGSNVRRLTSLRDGCWGPAWSPDGRQIIFFSPSALLVMNADGSSLARLIKAPPRGAWDFAAAWRR